MKLGPRTAHVLLALLLVAAAAVRLAFWLEVRGTHLYSVPLLDSSYYMEWASRIVAGDWGRGQPYWMGPLYPHLLALLYALFGVRAGPPQILQWLLSLLDVWLVWRIGRRAMLMAAGGDGASGSGDAGRSAPAGDAGRAGAGSGGGAAAAAARSRAEAVGLAAAALYAFYGPPVFYASLLIMAVPLTTLFLLVVWQALRAVERPSRGRWLGLGLLVGVTGIARGNVLLLLPILPLLLWGRLGVRPGAARRRALRLTGLLWLGGVLAILPVTIRNVVVGGDLVLLTSNAGLNLYIGQQEEYGGIFAPVWLESERWFDPYGIRPLEEELGRSLKPSEVSRIWTRRALARIAHEPLAMARLYLVKAYRLLNAYEVPQLEAWQVRRHEFGALALLPVPNLLLMAAGLVGLWLLPRRSRVVLGLLVAGYLASLLPFFPTSRYRQPIEPLLAIGTAVFLLALWERLRSAARAGGAPGADRWRPVLRLAGPALLLAVALYPGWAPLDAAEISWHAHVHDAIRAAKAGDRAAIWPAIARAEAAMPDNPVSEFRLGTVWEEAGDDEKALAAYRAAAERIDDDPWVTYRLGRVLDRLGRPQEALDAFARSAAIDPDWARPYFGAAMVHRQLGDLETATAEMAHALELAPGAVQYASNLAGMLAEAGRLDEARTVLEDITARRPDYAPGWFNLAVLELQTGRPDAARAALRHIHGPGQLEPRQVAMIRQLREALGLPPE